MYNMQTNRPLLSVCIPTFNRPVELRTTLSIVATQIAALPIEMGQVVQCIVSDNHSSYDARALVAEFSERIALEIFVQESNVGPTMNFEYCYRRAGGKYVLILSDDDHLMDGALKAILTILYAYKPDIVFLPFTPQLKKIGVSGNLCCMKRNEFLSDVGILPSLISACILNRDLIVDILGQYLDTNMHHYNYFLHVVEHGETFYSFSHQMLDCPYEHNAGGYNWFAVFGDQIFRIIDDFPAQRINRALLNVIENKLLIDRIIPTFANRRIQGYTINQKFNEDTERKILIALSKRCRRFWAYWAILLPLYLIPRRILIAIKHVYKLKKYIIQS